MKQTRWKYLLGVLLALSLLAAACGSDSKSDDAAADTSSGDKAETSDTCVDGDTVTLGFLNSTSGAMAISEQTVRDSLSLAATEINADGGIMGKKIKFIEEDGQSCLLYTSPSPRDGLLSRMPSSA